MSTAACLPIAADRSGACVRTLFCDGLDLTGVTLALEMRTNPEVPGPAAISLGMGATANAEGLRLVEVTTVAGTPVSRVTIRVNESTMKDAAKLPYTGELGSASLVYYDLIGIFGQDKRRLCYGTFTALPTVYGMDNAPANRPLNYGGQPSAGETWNSARLTFTNDSVTVKIDGADLVGIEVGKAKAAADLAGRYANGLVDADIPGAQPGERSAQFWASIVAQRFVPSDDPTYVGYLVDGSDAQNILARWRRDTGAMEFIYSADLTAKLAKGDAAATALAARFVDSDDPTYIGYLSDSSADGNIVARFRRDNGAMEFVYDETLAAAVVNAGIGAAAVRPSGAKLKGAFRRWGKGTGVTISDSTVNDTSLPVRYTCDPNSPAPFTLYGGYPVLVSGGVRIYRAVPDWGQSVGRMAFMTDAPVVQMSVGPGTLGLFRLYVDGQLASDEKQAFATGGGPHYPRATFPTPRTRGRRIDVEIPLDAAFNVTPGIGTVAVPAGYRIWAVDTSSRVRIGIIGDSYSDGAGSRFPALGWFAEFGRMLGGVDVDVLSDGRGSTGYIASRPGGTNNSAANGYGNTNTSGDPVRLDSMAAWGPDILLFALGINDFGQPNVSSDLKPAALYAYQQARARMPGVPIVVLGPWPGTSGPSAAVIAAENLIRAAVDQFADPACVFVPVCTATPKPAWYGTGYSGAKNGSGSSDWMIGGTDGTDSVHPTDEGHRAIAAYVASAVLPNLRNFTRY